MISIVDILVDLLVIENLCDKEVEIRATPDGDAFFAILEGMPIAACVSREALEQSLRGYGGRIQEIQE